MHRCAQPAGRYRVTIRIAHHPEPYRVQITGHRDVTAEIGGSVIVLEPAPWVGTTEPFEGELCLHELGWLNGIPGKDWRPEYEFTIERLPD